MEEQVSMRKRSRKKRNPNTPFASGRATQCVCVWLNSSLNKKKWAQLWVPYHLLVWAIATPAGKHFGKKEEGALHAREVFICCIASRKIDTKGNKRKPKHVGRHESARK